MRLSLWAAAAGAGKGVLDSDEWLASNLSILLGSVEKFACVRQLPITNDQ